MTWHSRRGPSPIRGHKAALVVVDRSVSAAWFAGLSVDIDYLADDVAVCAGERCPASVDHDTPAPGGACGFSASAEAPLELLAPEVALLDVDLFGRVVRHERGWRASRQRVLGVSFVRGCQGCLAVVETPLLVAISTPRSENRLLVVPRCRGCAEVVRWPSSAAPVGRVELAGLLRTDVGFADERLSAQILHGARLRRGTHAA